MKRALAVFVALVCVFSCLPLLIVVQASFNSSNYLRFPPSHYGVDHYVQAFQLTEFRAALVFSLVLALIVACAAACVGTAAAYALTRYEFTSSRAVATLLLSPIVVPGVIIGIGLLEMFILLNVSVAPFGLLLGHLITAVPYTLIFVMSALSSSGSQRLEWASLSLGASTWETFRWVTLPIIMPGLAAGAVLAFIHSFDETTISLFTTTTSLRTLPILVFYQVVDQAPVVIAESAIMIIISLALVVAVQWKFGVLEVLMRRGGAAPE